MKKFLLVLALAGTACSSHAPAAPFVPASFAGAGSAIAATGPAHAIVPFGINKGSHAGFNLSLGVAGAKARPFLFDTGSSGFWVYSNVIGTGYRKTKYKMTNKYSSGLQYEGTVVYGDVDFGKGLTATNVPFIRVDSVTCDTIVPNCVAKVDKKNCPGVSKTAPNAGMLCVEAGRKLYGTFGADLSAVLVPATGTAQLELYNMIFAIAPWSTTFVVTPQGLELGPLSTSGFVFSKMKTLGAIPVPMPNGSNAWNRDVRVCFTVGTVIDHRCIQTVFDTGASAVDFQLAVKLPLTSTKNCGEVATKGTAFSMETENGTPLASMSTGYNQNWNVVVSKGIDPLFGKPQVNTGLTFYNRDAILFDGVKGRVGLKPLPSHGNVGVTACN